MNAVNLYISACRLVMQADPDNRDTYAELYKLLPYLRQSLTCTVCGRILSDPFTPTETSCQHHVCKMCIGGKKRLKPNCSWCKDYETYIENTQMQVVIKCYRKLCSYLKATCMYKKLSTVISNGGNYNLTEIIDEAVGISENEKKNAIGGSISDCNSTDTCTSAPSNSTSPVQVVPAPTLENSDIGSVSNESLNLSTNVEVEPKIEPKLEVNDKEPEYSKPFIQENECRSISPLLTVDSSAISNDIPDYDINRPISSFPMTVIFPETPSASSLSTSGIDVPVASISEIKTEDKELPLLSQGDINSVSTTTITSSITNSSLPLDNHKIIFNHSDLSSVELICTSSDSITPPLSVNTNSTLETKDDTQIFNSVNISESSTISPNVINNDNTVHELQLGMQSVSSPSIYPVRNISDPIKISSSSFGQVEASTVINPVISSLELPSVPSTTTTPITCVFNVSPGTIFSSTNMKPTGQESLLKQTGSPINNSSMYSVMYSNSESTKITIKRKPPDIENVKKVPIEREKLPISSQEMKKSKPKPKPKPKRKGCRCGNATPTPGKLTCCGQRCPCYVEAKACIECQCRGCRNPHRPGGKKVRPVIPQLGNIQIHQVQPVHPRVSTLSASHNANTYHQVGVGTISTQTPIMTTSGNNPQTIRAVHAMHAVQAVHGVGQIHSVPSGMHQLINIGGGIMDSPLTTGINVNTDLTLKPVNFALSSIPAQLLIHDDKSTSNSASDNSDIDIDI